MAQCFEEASRLCWMENDEPVSAAAAAISIPRELSQDERAALENDSRLVSDFRRHKFEQEAKKHWDLFYKRNQTKFFKDRHWTTREFEELTESVRIMIKMFPDLHYCA